MSGKKRRLDVFREENVLGLNTVCDLINICTVERCGGVKKAWISHIAKKMRDTCVR